MMHCTGLRKLGCFASACARRQIRQPLLSVSTAQLNRTIVSRCTRQSSSSSNSWVRRQARDPFVKQRNSPHLYSKQPTNKSKHQNNSTQSLEGAFESAEGQRALEKASTADTTAPVFVARSAFKLIELDDKCRLFGRSSASRRSKESASRRSKDCSAGSKHSQAGSPLQRVIVDLGCAPGGWIQAAHLLLERQQGTTLATEGRAGTENVIVGVDLLKVDSRIVNDLVSTRTRVQVLQGNFLDSRVQAQVAQLARTASCTNSGNSFATADATQNRVVDIVLSDMMSNMSGNSTRDAQHSYDLCTAALRFSLDTLTSSHSSQATHDQVDVRSVWSARPRLVIKHFQSDLTKSLRNELEEYFEKAVWVKPSASRQESREGYFVCSGLIEEARDGRRRHQREGQVESDELWF
ncbi:hypothetical protein ACM66B_000307 [Microbotryomycetes sp. NB124-2]